MKSTILLLLVTALASCASNALRNASNESALLDPDHITLKDGIVYHFQEGDLTGRMQKFHSQYSYQRALIIGNTK